MILANLGRQPREKAGYPWLRIRGSPAGVRAFEASEVGLDPMHYIQSARRHSSVSVTEKYYANI